MSRKVSQSFTQSFAELKCKLSTLCETLRFISEPLRENKNHLLVSPPGGEGICPQISYICTTMMSDKQNSDYLVNKWLFDTEVNSFNAWLETCCENNRNIHKEPAFREELRRRLIQLHKVQVPAEAYELIEYIDRRFRDMMDRDKTDIV